MKKKIAIIHFLPLELYPPIMNLLDYLSVAQPSLNIIVFTTKAQDKLTPYSNANLTIYRYSPIDPDSSKYLKYYRYMVFYVSTFFSVNRFEPSSILYMETISALPALWYKKIKKKLAIYAHYHEIVTLKDLQSKKWLNKYINSNEKKMYQKFRWISQTNEDRMDLFIKLNGLSKSSKKLKILPNYPPSSWIEKEKNTTKKDGILKLLYIGSLSLNGTYVLDVLSHFGSNPNFSIDFYSHHITNEVKSAIIKHSNCNIKGTINYHEIPKLKGNYDVGLVLYKDHSINYKFNAPNKLFEYLALDLDVWCSDKLITAKKYQRTHCYPKMLMVDYNNLSEFDVEKAINRRNLTYSPSPYTSESVYKDLLFQLK